ncbi:unnamed protein product [marine sediment metagenome]|uniref:Uncharacterized protein n=1 Tax=marine sediment metagenome TaxID=412755 RepID=X1S543_9ZZZZ
MTDIGPKDFLPQPPWQGPPVPRYFRKKPYLDMIGALRAQQRGEVVVEEFVRFTNQEVESVIRYLQKEMEGK